MSFVELKKRIRERLFAEKIEQNIRAKNDPVMRSYFDSRFEIFENVLLWIDELEKEEKDSLAKGDLFWCKMCKMTVEGFSHLRMNQDHSVEKIKVKPPSNKRCSFVIYEGGANERQCILLEKHRSMHEFEAFSVPNEKCECNTTGKDASWIVLCEKHLKEKGTSIGEKPKQRFWELKGISTTVKSCPHYMRDILGNITHCDRKGDHEKFGHTFPIGSFPVNQEKSVSVPLTMLESGSGRSALNKELLNPIFTLDEIADLMKKIQFQYEAATYTSMRKFDLIAAQISPFVELRRGKDDEMLRNEIDFARLFREKPELVKKIMEKKNE